MCLTPEVDDTMERCKISLALPCSGVCVITGIEINDQENVMSVKCIKD